MYSTEVAGKNIQKVLNEEYYASKEDTTKALQSVGNKEAKSAIVPSPVAHLELVEQTKEEHGAGKLVYVIHTLKTHQQFTVPMSSRIAVNNLVKVIADMRDGKNPNLRNAMNAFSAIISGTEIESQVSGILDQFIADSKNQNLITKEQFNNYILDIRTQCSNDKEWEMIGLPSPLKTV